MRRVGSESIVLEETVKMLAGARLSHRMVHSRFGKSSMIPSIFQVPQESIYLHNKAITWNIKSIKP